MKCLGTFMTQGGPVCVATLESAKLWTGSDRDYWPMIKEAFRKEAPRKEVVHSFIASNGENYLIFRASGFFTILRDDESFMVLDALALPDHLDTAEFCAAKPPSVARHLLKLRNFGGTTAIFDSSLHGDQIKLDSEGVDRTYPARQGTPPDVAIIDVPCGTWNINYVEYKIGKPFTYGFTASVQS